MYPTKLTFKDGTAFLAPTQYYVCDRACVCGVVNILQLWMDSIYMEYNMEETAVQFGHPVFE